MDVQPTPQPALHLLHGWWVASCPRLWLRARPTPRAAAAERAGGPAAARPDPRPAAAPPPTAPRYVQPRVNALADRLPATTVPLPPVTRLASVGLRQTRGRGSSPTAPCLHVPPGSGCWLTSHNCMAALARKGHPRPTSSGPAAPAPDPGDVGLGSSKVAAGKEPAAPALGRYRPQLCPGPLPASVLRPCGLGSQPHPSLKEGR